MNSDLAKKLIEKGLIRQGTVFEASYKGISLSGLKTTNSCGEFIVLSAKVSNNEVVFDVKMEESNSFFKLKCNDIFKIDGMDIDKLEELYFKPEKPAGKKRGRKPRSETI